MIFAMFVADIILSSQIELPSAYVNAGEFSILSAIKPNY
jgi:hypothetical protein